MLGRFAFFLLGFAFFAAEVSGEDGNGNELMDTVLNFIKTEIKDDIEPLRLENQTIDVKFKPLFITYRINLGIFNGLVSGLTTINREGNTTLTTDTTFYNVSSHLTAGVINLEAEGIAKFMDIGPHIRILGKVPFIALNIKVAYRIATKQVVVEDIEIKEMEKMTVKITGLGPLGWALSYIVGFIQTWFKSVTVSLLEVQMKKIVQDRVKDMKFEL